MTRIGRFSGCLLSFLGWCMGASTAHAQPKAQPRPRPPLEYQITEVVLTVSSHSSLRSVGPTTFHLQAGMAWFQGTDRVRKAFSFSGEQMLEALEPLYAMRFFDLPADLLVRHAIRMDSNGTVRASTLRLMDTGGTRVCFRSGDFEKCVSYGLDAPAPLVRWVDDQRSAALRAVDGE